MQHLRVKSKMSVHGSQNWGARGRDLFNCVSPGLNRFKHKIVYIVPIYFVAK